MTRTLCIVCSLLTLALVAPALGQESPNELRVENDKLKARIAELEAELERAEERIEALQAENRRLRRAAMGDGGAADDEGEAEGADQKEEQAERAPMPSDPLAAPGAMLASLRGDWEQELGPADIASPADLRDYLREARRWAARAEHDSRGAIEWIVRVVQKPEPGGRGAQAFRMAVVDEASGLDIGEPFEVEVYGRNASRLESALEGDRFVLDGSMTVELEADERVGEEGPGVLAPYIRADVEVNPRTIRDR